MSSYDEERRFHLRLKAAEDKLRRHAAAPTIPKYDITGRPGGLASLITVSEIGSASSTTLGDTLVVPIAYQDVLPTDMIWVMAMAPSVRALGVTPAFVNNVVDTGSNTYDLLRVWFLEDNPPQVNKGVQASFWASDQTLPKDGLTVGSDQIVVYWNDTVYDRFATCWLIRFTGGISNADPVILSATPDNDAATYAASQVALSIPNVGISYNGSLLFGNIITVRAAGAPGLAYGGITGYDGFVEVRNHSFGSIRQDYSHHMQTAFANALLINSSLNPVYEIDQGLANAGDSISAFNGMGQHYEALVGGSFVPQTNFWKGGIVHLITNTP